MAEPRIIKKYANRCLYDTQQSKYVSLADLRGLVVAGVPFEVRETKGDRDITRQVLMQIIVEEEEGGTPLFSTDLLRRFIRMYGGSMQAVFSEYMLQATASFDQQARQFLDQIEHTMPASPMALWSELARKNLDLWQDLQKNSLEAAGLPGGAGKDE